MPIVHCGGATDHNYYMFLSILQKHGKIQCNKLIQKFKDETGSRHSLGYLQELHESGLVARTRNKSDGTIYSITSYGLEFVRAIENGTKCIVIVK